MKFLSNGATEKVVENATEKRENLIRIFQENLHNKYTSYAVIFILCEFLNCVVVVLVFFITNAFLDNHFLFYGPNVIMYYRLPNEEQQLSLKGDKYEHRQNPMCEAFPRVASCDYIRYGGGGVQEHRSAICVLGLNMINDKVLIVHQN